MVVKLCSKPSRGLVSTQYNGKKNIIRILLYVYISYLKTQVEVLAAFPTSNI